MKSLASRLIRRPVWVRYGLGLVLFGVAFGLRIALLPAEARLAFATFLPSVVLTLYFCGIGPGVLVTGLGAAAAAYFFSPPYYSWELDSVGIASAFAFTLTSALTGWVVYRLRAVSANWEASLSQLAATERTLQAVISGQTEMLFRFDRNGRFVFINEVGAKTFGLTDSALGRDTWLALVAPDERPEVFKTLQGFSPSNPVVQTVTRIPSKDGRKRWGEFIHHASFDSEGNIVEVQTVGRDITERHELQEQLLDVTRDLLDLYNNAPCGYFSLDPQGLFIRVNATFLSWVGCKLGEVVGKLGPRDFFTEEGVADFNRCYPVFIKKGVIGPLEFDLIGRDGSWRRVSVSATAVTDAQGVYQQSRSVMHDITDAFTSRKKLMILTHQQALILDNDLVGMVKLRDRQAIWCNRALERMFGYAPGELNGKFSRSLYLDDESYKELGASAYPILAAGGTYRTQMRMARKGGRPIWVDMSGGMLSANLGESLWMMLDITAMKERQEAVEKAAFFDSLTGLPNRMLLNDRLNQAIPVATRHRSIVAVSFIDLDGFKAVNDEFGHAAGDKLLQAIAQRLLECVRGNDTVARLGGDEFVILLTHLKNQEECSDILTRISFAISAPVDIGSGRTGQVSASIGTAYCPEDGSEVEALLQVADTRMYAQKQARKQTH